jgi:prepilin-type N-terminal cleavage/methylation domain-containing protein
MKRSRGFTLIELLVVVAIIALLVSILVPSLAKVRELAKRALCGGNLNGIGKGFAMYQAENNDAWPIIPDLNQSSATYTTNLKLGEFCTLASLGDGAQQNLSLLVKSGFLGWDIMICGSTDLTKADRSDDTKKYGLGEVAGSNRKVYTSYGIQVPYSVNNTNLCPLKSNMAPDIPILGDRAPDLTGLTGATLLNTWSDNHNEGENLLYAGINVKWSTEQAKKGTVTSFNAGGWGNNNVYTRDTWTNGSTDNPTLTAFGNASGLPNSTKDTVLYAWR